MYKLRLVVEEFNGLNQKLDEIEESTILRNSDKDIVLEAFETAESVISGLIEFTHGRYNMED